VIPVAVECSPFESGQGHDAVAAADTIKQRMQRMAQDPWASAQASTKQPIDHPQSNLTGDFEPESQLFGGGQGAGPSVFTKDHKVGDVVEGTITAAPFDRQSTDIAGNLRYWTEKGRGAQPTTSQTPWPIMDTVVPLSTEYRFSAEELKKREMDEDDGTRAFYAGGEALKALRAAVKEARITSGSQMVGMKFRAKRSGTKPTNKGNDAWLYEVHLSR
jgi:hypothetical protein